MVDRKQLPAVQAAKVSINGELTPEQIELIKRTICKDASDDELALFTQICNRTRLDPFARQIYAIKRWDSKLGIHVMGVQTSIDGLRVVAERSGKFGGKVGTWWCGPDGEWKDVWLKSEPPSAAKVTVTRTDFTQPLTATARYAAYVQTTKDGQPNQFWSRMADVMTAKCAEALALRQICPQQLSGLYTEDEAGVEAPSLIPTVVDAENFSLMEQTNIDLLNSGHLTTVQQKQVTLWMRAKACESTGQPNWTDAYTELTQEEWDMFGEECLTVLEIEITPERLEDVIRGQLNDRKQTVERQTSPKRGELAAARKAVREKNAMTQAEQEEALKKSDGNGVETPKSLASKPAGGTVANIPEQMTVVASATNISAGKPTTESPKAPAASAAKTTSSKPQTVPAKASATAVTGVGVRSAAPLVESVVVTSPQVELLLHEFLEHINHNRSDRQAPTVEIDGVLLSNLAAANGWHPWCRGEVMKSTFQLDANNINNPHLFTWAALEEMAQFFATTPQPEGLLEEIKARRGKVLA